MPTHSIDLATPLVWLVFLATVAVLTPLAHGRPRRWVFAAVNVAFLGLLLPLGQWTVVLAGVLVAWLLLRVMVRPGFRLSTTLALGAVLLVLFLLRKLPWLGDELNIAVANPLLVALGFSYIMLRMFDLGRAVFEGRHPPPDLLTTINYLVPFHMLAAGPIQAYDEFVVQSPVPPKLKTPDVLAAVERIALGLFKKLVLAYILDEVFLTGFRTDGWYLVFEAQIFSLWLYLDFSGYSDIAVGMGRLMGVATPENFDRPYFARNMINYWERWHITLGQWIRRNLFIPLQLVMVRRTDGRHPLWCASVAFVVAFALCGLWHGLSWQFLAWGLLHAGGMVLNNLHRHFLRRRLGSKGLKRYLADGRIRVVAVIVTFEFVALSLVVAFYPLERIWP